jgi:predicted nucleotide-binding protein (sugar kinase/HSP70/actin superfamily)
MERLPFLYNDCYDLIGKLDQETLLNTYVSILIDVVEKVKARTQRNDKTDYTEVISVVADVVSQSFPGIKDDFVKMLTNLLKKHHPKFEVDFGAEANRELNEHLKDKFIGECDKAVKAGDKIRKHILSKHNPSEEE